MKNFIAIITSSSIMLVQKCLVNTERVEIYTLQYFSKTRNLKLFLRSNGDADELPTQVPIYYMKAIKKWSRLSELLTT